MSLAKCIGERNSAGRHEHPRRAASSNDLPLRPAGGARPAGRAAASGAACRTPVLSYSLTVEPKQHFINWQQDPQGNHLARLVFPEKTDQFEVMVDLVADMTVINPFDFFLEPEAEQWPFAYDASLAEEIAPFRKVEPPGPLLDGVARQGRSQQAAHHRFPRRPQCAAAAGDRLHRAPGAGRADLRGDAGARQGLVPRHRLAAGHHPAPSRLRRALRLGLPDPAHARREAARGTRGPDARLHRPPCLVRGLSAGRRLDRPRSDLGPADRRRPHPARLHARAVERRADRRRGREGRGRRSPTT